MRLLNINCYAEGYYSGATYEENILIPADTFDNLPEEVRDKIINMKIGVGELDGKHSECFAEITQDGIQYFEDGEAKNSDMSNNRSDGEKMYYKLDDIFKENGIDLDEEIIKAEKYINTLDTYITKEYRIKKSWIDKVNEFIKTLGE